ncbi:hypothetical protein FLK61_35255 [Paenalkalicoccus suaedae]|uniref:Uncharacterized protein n=1 Tax=Paenalkalicoccus suaedae TaxID=2592382 RepID=A0A859FGJ7_9BACI|nr:hypothetical protein [Paenalkalicoccus suaedae]QKS71928.1 hypothetical protein FLK61_35255 [Paenalkalicoccus suaedae]
MKEIKTIKSLSPFASDIKVSYMDPDEIEKRYPKRVKSPEEQEWDRKQLAKTKVGYQIGDQSKYYF